MTTKDNNKQLYIFMAAVNQRGAMNDTTRFGRYMDKSCAVLDG